MAVLGDARPTFTFPAARHHRPLAGTKLYCLVTEARVGKRLVQGCTRRRGDPDLNPRPVVRNSIILTIRPPSHTFDHATTDGKNERVSSSS